MIGKELRTEIETAIRANPMLPDIQFGERFSVDEKTISKIRKDAGLWTHRRVRVRNGNVEVFRLKQRDPVAADCFEGVSDEILRRLHLLQTHPEGAACLELIENVLEIVDESVMQNG